MQGNTIGRLAIASLMLGVSTVACTPDGAHVEAVGNQAPKAEQVAAREAAKARDALGKHKGDKAVAAAEAAVAAQPRDAAYRLLLGQSYLAAGRFASAEAALHDALTLNPGDGHARFDLAMAQTAQGRGAQALSTLHALAGTVPAADLGLALAMAGDRAAGIQMLIDAARSNQATARTRQNLALAYALDGRWLEARAVAMQDTPADRINDQIAQWAALATPQQGQAQAQVATMLGVKPVKDPGQPTELALRDTAPATELAAAAPAFQPAPAPAPAPIEIAAAAPAVLPVATKQVDMPLPAPAPTPAPRVAVVERVGQSGVTVALDPPKPPVMVAAAMSRPAVTPVLLRAPAKPYRLAPERVAQGGGEWAVQLGAYSRADMLEAAWARLSARAPSLASYIPAQGAVRLSRGSFVRLSVSGLHSRSDAVSLCERVRAHGSACFVRQMAGDHPAEWVRRDVPTELASR